MDKMIAQQLQQYSNFQFLLHNHRKINFPRGERHTSFSEVSNWSNSDKLTAKLPTIYSRCESSVVSTKNRASSPSYNSSVCPIRQMDMHLELLKKIQGFTDCKYINDQVKSPLKPVQFLRQNNEDQKRTFSNGQFLYSKERQKKRAQEKEHFMVSKTRQRNKDRLYGQRLSVGKLREILKRQKNNRMNMNIEDYLKTKQFVQKIESNSIIK